MKRRRDAGKLIQFLKDNPQGASRNKIMRECDIHSESSFYDTLKLARMRAQIDTSEKGTRSDHKIPGRFANRVIYSKLRRYEAAEYYVNLKSPF